MVDVVVDGASVYPEIKAGFLDGVVPVGSYCYRCVLQVGHNQLFYAVKLRRKAQHGNSSSGRLSGILGDFVGFCDTPCIRSDKHSFIFHPRKALSVGLHQKNAFCSFRRYSWGGDKQDRVTPLWKPCSRFQILLYINIFLFFRKKRIDSDRRKLSTDGYIFSVDGFPVNACQRLSTLLDLSKYMTFNELRCGYLVKAEMPTSYK